MKRMEFKLYGKVEISRILIIKGKVYFANILDLKEGKKLQLTNYKSKINTMMSDCTVGESAADILRDEETIEWLNSQFENSEPYIGSVMTKLSKVL